MATMHFPDEIRPTGELELPEEEALVSDQEVAMATTLIDQLTGTFEPEGLQDEYRVAMERVIEVKLGSAEPDTTVTTQPKSTVGDLMEALRASIEASKQSASEESNGKPSFSSTSKGRSRKKKATPAG
jgi:DNA end-binding protein Ku